MFSHVMVGSNDIARSTIFYDALFTAVGGKPGRTDDKGRLSYLHKGAAFMVSKPIDGQPACHANGGTIGFAAREAPAVDAAHAAGTGAGGTTCEDPPGRRDGAFGPLYLAYLRDPAGNKICVLHRIKGDG